MFILLSCHHSGSENIRKILACSSVNASLPFPLRRIFPLRNNEKQFFSSISYICSILRRSCEQNSGFKNILIIRLNFNKDLFCNFRYKTLIRVRILNKNKFRHTVQTSDTLGHSDIYPRFLNRTNNLPTIVCQFWNELSFRMVIYFFSGGLTA